MTEMKDQNLKASLVDPVSIYLGRFGKNISKNQISEALSASPSTESGQQIKDAISSFNFVVQIGQAPARDLTNLILPALILGKDGSCAVLEAFKDGYVTVNQGLKGQQKWHIDEDLNDWFVGRYIQAQPANEDQKSISSRLKALSPFKSLGLINFVWIAIAAFFSNVLNLATSLFVMVVYDRVLPNQATESLYALAIGVGLAIVFDTILKNAKNGIVDYAALKADTSVTEDIFEQFVEARASKDKKSVGELASIMRDFELYRDFMNSATILAFVDLPFVFLFIFVIYLIAGPLFIVPLLCVPAIILIILLVQPLLVKNSKAVSVSTQTRQGLLVEVLSGLDTLRVGGAFAFMKRKFLAQSAIHTQASNQAKNYAHLNGNIITIVQQIAQVATIVYGFHLFVSQDITMGAIIGTVILSGRALGPLAKLGQTLGRANAALVAYNNLKEFLSNARSDANIHSGTTLSQNNLAIEISNVTLRLSENGQPLFSGMNLSIKPGEKVAIIGRSGSGKTTLLRLILGLIQPEVGNIAVNGADIRQFKRADIFRVIGSVFQEPWIFAGSLRDNVTFSQEDCSDEWAVGCLKFAGANFIGDGSLSSLDQFMQDRGGNLSGGQKQSVMIARALASSPPIYLFDEPTSAMDGQTEGTVIDSLMAQLQNKTAIIVTHKPRLVALCDRVIVMDKGRIVGDGTREAYFNALKERGAENAK